MSSDQRCSDLELTKRDIPSFIEPRPPLILNPFMRPRPHKGTNLMERFEDSESEEADWVQVYLRLKPCSVRNNLYEVKNDQCLITSSDTAPAGHGRRTQHSISKMYTFSHIFRPESTQKEIFEHVVKDNLKKLPEGHNFTLLTYGASGSGKTYTLMGTVTAPGLVPRSLEYVFRLVDAAQVPLYKPSEGVAEKLSFSEQEYEFQFVRRLRQLSGPLRDKYRRMSAQLRKDMTSNWDLANRTQYYVWVSFIEIYNEAIYDLLSNCDRSKATSKLRIREDSNGLVYVKGATHAFVRSGEEAYDVMVAGKHNLQVAATGVHANSSRSHCIFTITMLTESDGGVRQSCVRLCDLAGSERARSTRNTGARMQESRAINSSLHVLERCLHMLRRKQRHASDATLVPYRESKLTRLLGAGLSGARGEAVSMVVTINPATEYAHETRHVLQLAAVARDIQVNQTTIAESILESTVDTTVESSAEVMRLRAENERLHYELAQAETRNKDLISAMEEKQQEVAKTMFEIVEEAKDMTKQYYESQLRSLRTEMEEMQDEYEQRIKQLSSTSGKSDACDDSCWATKKVVELNTDNAILVEKLNAEKLARARLQREVEHLRACIEERDEKAHEDLTSNIVEELTSESESEEDPANESLEPSFRKEDINRSRLLRQSILNDTNHNESNSDHEQSVLTDANESVLEKSSHTLKDDSHDDSKDITIGDANHDDTYQSMFGTSKNKADDTFDANKVNAEGDAKSSLVRGTYFVSDTNVLGKSNGANARGTYFVSTAIFNNTSNNDSSIKENDDDSIRTASMDSDQSNLSIEKEPQTVKKNMNRTDGSLAQFEQLEMDAEKEPVKKKIQKADGSLAQFEQFEIAANSKKMSIIKDTESDKSNSNKEKEQQTVKRNMGKADISLAQFEQLEKAANSKEISKDADSNRSDSITEKEPQIVKKNMHRAEGSLAQFEQLEIAANSNKISIINDTDSYRSNSKVGKEPQMVNKNKHRADGSLAQFEQLEKAANSKKMSLIENTTELISNIKIFNEKRNYFDQKQEECLVPIELRKEKTYFDNIGVNIDKKVDDVNKNELSDDRSPSIVKDEVAGTYDPTTIKKLLGESFRADRISSVHKSVAKPKKQASVDIFEGFDSPGVIRTKENITANSANKSNIELQTKSPEKRRFFRSMLENTESKNTNNYGAESFEKTNAVLKLQERATKDEIFIKPEPKESLAPKTVTPAPAKEKLSILDTCIEKSKDSTDNDVEMTRKSLKNIKLNSTVSAEVSILDKAKEKSFVNMNETGLNMTKNNTIDEFDNLFNNVTMSKATEFDLLVSQNSTMLNETNAREQFEKPKYNLRHKANTSVDKKDKSVEINSKTEDTDKLENKDQSYEVTGKTIHKERKEQVKVLLESKASESKATFPKRNLRLRRRKNQDDDSQERDKQREEDKKSEQEKDNSKLKDIINLQKEFSDVTLDVPVIKKETADIPSPEKKEEEEENKPPLGVQSCPSKSITKSRRKLFTPRAEPLEESMTGTGDSEGHERVRVPRPSYHRARARRKL